MKNNNITGVITAFIAIILSIVFVVSAVCAVMCSAAASVMKPKNIISFVQSIDYVTLMSEFEESVNNSAPDEPVAGTDAGIDEELLDDIMKSNTAKELVGEYAQGITSVFTGDELPEGLTVDKFKTIVDENMGEIVKIAREHSDEEVSDEDLRYMIKTAVDENAEDIVNNFPSVEDVNNVTEYAAVKLLKRIFSPTAVYVLAGITAVLALLIFVCRRKRFEGLLWLGIDCIAAGTIAATAKLVVSLARSVIVDMIGVNSEIVTSALSIVTVAVNTGIIVMFAIAAVCIAAYIILRKTVIKKSYRRLDND